MYYGMNEHFVPNMTGKTVKFDIQPYTRGEGVIEKITTRVVKQERQFMLPYGRVNLEYEVFDLEVKMASGTHTGALLGGVPVTREYITGTLQRVTGVSYEKLYEAVEQGKTITIALCG